MSSGSSESAATTTISTPCRTATSCRLRLQLRREAHERRDPREVQEPLGRPGTLGASTGWPALSLPGWWGRFQVLDPTSRVSRTDAFCYSDTWPSCPARRHNRLGPDLPARV